MSDTSRLPAHPSLEQLRKQAKERLRTLEAVRPSATLADAQHELAREYGYGSWPKLVDHIGRLQSSARLEQFERMADDLLAGYDGDRAALERLIADFGVSYSPAQLQVRVRSRIDDARGHAEGTPTLADVRQIVAVQYGYEDWTALAMALTQPARNPAHDRLSASTHPPFYRLDAEHNRIEPRPPLSDADWDVIVSVMKERRITRVSTPAITDRAMAKLSRLEVVTAVHADGAQALTDDGLQHLAKMPQLRELELGGWHCPLTDRALDVLKHLTALRRFSICWARRISDAGTANLTFCDDLEFVDLMGTPTGDGTINALRGKRHLGDLRTGHGVTNAGLALLNDFPMFRIWRGGLPHYDLMAFAPDGKNLLLDGPFTDRGLASLAGLEGLFGLGFFRHANAFTAEGLASLAALPNLGFLAVPGDRCDDDAMRAITTIPTLRMLLAQGTVATDAGFKALGRSETLEYLWGRECPNLHGRGFAALSGIATLRGLGVSCKQVDDASLSTLPQFPALRQLMPMDVSDAGFRHVGACTQLEDLWCMYCRDTGDEATEHLTSLHLKSYYAGKTRITDRSLGVLGRMTTLEKLEFWETAGVTDAGLAALAKLPRLRSLSISGAPRVTRAGLSIFPRRVRVEFGG